MSAEGNIKISTGTVQTLALDLGNVEYNPKSDYNQAWANGTGADQINQVFADTRTLGATTSEELDMSGALTDALGNSITFTAIKSITVMADSANGGNIEVGGAAANGFNSWVGAVGDLVIIPSGGAFSIVAPDATGFAVTLGTADLLKINNTDAASGSYTIVLQGVE